MNESYEIAKQLVHIHLTRQEALELEQSDIDELVNHLAAEIEELDPKSYLYCLLSDF